MPQNTSLHLHCVAALCRAGLRQRACVGHWVLPKVACFVVLAGGNRSRRLLQWYWSTLLTVQQSTCICDMHMHFRTAAGAVLPHAALPALWCRRVAGCGVTGPSCSACAALPS